MHVCASICVKQKQFNVKFKLHQMLFDALTENNAYFFCIVCPMLFLKYILFLLYKNRIRINVDTIYTLFA